MVPSPCGPKACDGREESWSRHGRDDVPVVGPSVRDSFPVRPDDHNGENVRGEREIVVPTPSRVDTARSLLAALIELDPTGITSAGVGLINVFLPTALERRRRQFHEQVAISLSHLTEATDDLRRDVNECLALAALAQGTLSAARSASRKHLEYLANATARAFLTRDERSADHAMLLLRIAGDISATHVLLLEMYADPHAFAERAGKSFEWALDKHGQYPLKQVVAALDPELAVDDGFVSALFRDLERLGLVGDEVAMDRVIDGGGITEPPPEPVTKLGAEVLAFIADPPQAHAEDES